MLMVAGIPYDSDVARAICGAVSAIMTGEFLWPLPRKMSKELGPFASFHKNRKKCSAVMRNHRGRLQQ